MAAMSARPRRSARTRGSRPGAANRPRRRGSGARSPRICRISAAVRTRTAHRTPICRSMPSWMSAAAVLPAAAGEQVKTALPLCSSGLHVGVAERGRAGPQVRHRDELVAAHVDAAHQRDHASHAGCSCHAAQPSPGRALAPGTLAAGPATRGRPAAAAVLNATSHSGSPGRRGGDGVDQPAGLRDGLERPGGERHARAHAGPPGRQRVVDLRPRGDQPDETAR